MTTNTQNFPSKNTLLKLMMFVTAICLAPNIVSGNILMFYILLFVITLLIINKSLSFSMFATLFGSTILWSAFYFRPHVTIATINIFIMDALTIIFTLIVLHKYFINGYSRKRLSSLLFACLIIIACFVILNILRGIPYYGQTTFVAARIHMSSISIIFFFSLYGYNKKNLNRLFIVIIILSVILLIIIGARLLGVMPLMTETLYYNYLDSRIIDGREASFLLLFSFFALLISVSNEMIKNKVFVYILLPLLFVTIILLSIRTVWIMLFVGLFIFFLIFKKNYFKIMIPILLFSIIMITVVYLYNASTVTHYSSSLLSGLITKSNYESSTGYWRMEVSKAYLQSMAPIDYFLGVPFGKPICYFVHGVEWRAGLHNQFVEVFYYMGFLGFLAFLILNVYILVKLFRLMKIEIDIYKRNLLNILFISILLYNIGFFAWTLDALYSVLIGISLSVIGKYKYSGNTDKSERELIK